MKQLHKSIIAIIVYYYAHHLLANILIRGFSLPFLCVDQNAYFVSGFSGRKSDIYAKKWEFSICPDFLHFPKPGDMKTDRKPME